MDSVRDGATVGNGRTDAAAVQLTKERLYEWAESTDTTGTELAILQAIIKHANFKTRTFPLNLVSWPSATTLAKETHFSRRTILRTIKSLTKKGLVVNVTDTPLDYGLQARQLSKSTLYFVRFEGMNPPGTGDNVSPVEPLGNSSTGDRVSPALVTECHQPGDRVSPALVTECHPNSLSEYISESPKGIHKVPGEDFLSELPKGKKGKATPPGTVLPPDNVVSVGDVLTAVQEGAHFDVVSPVRGMTAVAKSDYQDFVKMGLTPQEAAASVYETTGVRIDPGKETGHDVGRRIGSWRGYEGHSEL